MASDSPAKKERGTLIGRYRVIKRVGAGGMGAVYKAVHLDLGREVALKVLPPDLANRADALERFRQEAQHAAQLRHEHIVTLYEFGEANGTHFLAMEFVEGINLHQYIDKKGKVEPEEARKLIIQSCKGLVLAHQQGIVHRDIKPSNFLLTEKDGKPFVKLTDFGLARKGDDTELHVTKTGTTVGTVDYIAPEQARNSRSADIRSDIYSLGCTLYHMLTGRPPFPDGDMTERLLKHIEAKPEDVRKFSPKVSDGLVQVLDRMMAKKPDDRYQTPAELLKDLENPPKGRAMNPRELLEALAAAEKPKPKPAAPETKKFAGTKSTRTLNVPDDPGTPIKLKYRTARERELRMEKAQNEETDSDVKSDLISGWKAWAVIAGSAVALALVIVVIVLAVSRKSADVPTTTSPMAGTPEPTTKATDKTAQTKTTPDSTAQPKQPKFGEVTQKNRTPDQGKPLERIYEPPPQAIAQMENEFGQSGNSKGNQGGSLSGADAGSEIGTAVKKPGVRPPVTPVPPPVDSKPPPTGSDVKPVPPLAVAKDITPLVVRRLALKDEKSYSSLAAACAALDASKEAIIEIHDDGPHYESPITLAGGRVTIRAGTGHRPLIAWDTRKPAAGQTVNALIAKTGGSLHLENLDFVVKSSDLPQESAACLLRVDKSNLSADDCSFSVSGRHAAGLSVIRLENGTAEPKRNTCRLTRCLVRGADITPVSVLAPCQQLTVEKCLIVSGAKPIFDVQARGGATPLEIRVAKSTLVTGQTLVRLATAEPSEKSPALQWLSWDTLLARYGNPGTGVLFELQDGLDTNNIKWRSVNSLFTGWQLLLKNAGHNIHSDQLTAWRELWHEGQGDAVASLPWPALVAADPSQASPAGFRATGTHAGFAASNGTEPIGCNVNQLPPGRENWLTLTYDAYVPPHMEPPNLEQAPAIPMSTNGTYSGETLDLNQVNLGAHLEKILAQRKPASRIVLRLKGKGEVASKPIHVEGAGLTLYFEPNKDGAPPAVLLPTDIGDRSAFIQVEGGSCEILGGSICLPAGKDSPPLQYAIKVQGGDLRLAGCRILTTGDLASPTFRGLIDFAGSGKSEADQAFECAIFDSVLASARGGIHLAGAGCRLRATNSVLASASDLIQVDADLKQAAKLNGGCVLEHNTIVCQGAVMRFADILELTGFADPWMVRANNNLFLAPFGDKGIRPNLLFIEPNSMSHGLLVWQGDGNGYDKRLSQMLNSASGSLSHEAWSMLWGPQGHRRPLLLEMPPDKTFDFTSPRFEMLALPEAERNRIKGSLPGADLDRLGLLPKGGANSK